MTSPQLDALQTRQYRSIVMRAAYLSQDRPDLSYSTMELARDMQKPTEHSMTNLKRLGRHLKKRPRLVQLFIEQISTANVVRLDVQGDSDHAGCLKTRKSTTGMVLIRDAHCLKVSSHTQLTISLSSGESARSMLADFGMCADVVVRTDVSSGLAVGSRRGLGSPPARADSVLVGAATSARGRPSLEEGAGRHERERRGGQHWRRKCSDELFAARLNCFQRT